VVLDCVTSEDIDRAKHLFRRFAGEQVLEETAYGVILAKVGDIAQIYVNGVKVAEEPQFLFSYDITSLTKKIKKALNRERTNVGRTAYTDRVKQILLCAQEEVIARALVEDLQGYSRGTSHDELNWIDVQVHAVKILNAANPKTVFLTSSNLIENPMMVDEARAAGREIVTIPDSLRDKVSGIIDINGNPIRDLNQFKREYNESFEYQFVAEEDLTPTEQAQFALKDAILDLIGGKPRVVAQVQVSENMKRDDSDFSPRSGVWDPASKSIIILRAVLSDLEFFCDVLLHEAGHASCGAPDVTRSFEGELSRFIGILAAEVLRRQGKV
jgi:hypothetical protein